MSRITVMHLMDSLAIGGAERVAVNLVNLLPRDKYHAYLCTTRQEGPLADLVAADVGRLQLNRVRTFQWGPLRKLVQFIRREQIQILHAHSSTLLIANLAALFPPFPKVIWHAHCGRLALENRSNWLYRCLTWRAAGVVTVNQPLADWARQRLGVSAHRVWYLPNFPSAATGAAGASAAGEQLPGEPGSRIVCVANLRPEKDHPSLIRAMARVVKQAPGARLLLVGGLENQQQLALVQQTIAECGLTDNVSVLGTRRDVPAILRACDVGVLSSNWEGLPLSLLEYGLAGLPVVATEVGQCGEVLNQGQCGLLVPTQSPESLADALLALLKNAPRRRELGAALHRRIQAEYSPDAAVRQLEGIYSAVLGQSSAAAAAARLLPRCATATPPLDVLAECSQDGRR